MADSADDEQTAPSSDSSPEIVELPTTDTSYNLVMPVDTYKSIQSGDDIIIISKD